MDSEPNAQPTCGMGLAANAELPARLAALLAARAEVLERHTRALDPVDSRTQPEHDAYTSLVRAHREIAGAMEALAQQMLGYRDLPMGQHDPAVIAAPDGQMEAFRRVLTLERELEEFLRTKIAQEAQLLP